MKNLGQQVLVEGYFERDGTEVLDRRKAGQRSSASPTVRRDQHVYTYIYIDIYAQESVICPPLACLVVSSLSTFFVFISGVVFKIQIPPVNCENNKLARAI